jgi:hypothetical protein
MIARNNYFFVKPKDILLYDPNITLSWSKETKTITLRAKSFVKDLYIFSDQQDLELPYNFIDLEPERTVQIKFNAEIKPGTTLKYFSLYHSSLNK